MIYSEEAIDYSAGMDIVDCETKQCYTEEEAYGLPAEIRRRLLLRPRKIGTYVLSLEELKEMGK